MSDAYTNAEAPYTLVAIVTPIADDPAISGKIRHLPCSPTVKHRQISSYKDDDGRTDYAIEPKYQRKGYVLLRDLFEAEGRHEDWAEYARMLDDLVHKRRIRKPFPDERLPKEVHRRRACGHEPEPVRPSRGGKAGESAMSGRTA